MAPRLLVVDDEKNTRESYVRLLNGKGYNALSVASGQEALMTMKEERFDLMLLDAVLPGMGGLEVLRQATEMMPDIPVLIVTGYGTIDMAVKATQYGAAGFLRKPVAFDELLANIEKTLARFKMQRKYARLETLMPLLKLNQQPISEMTEEVIISTIMRTASQATNADITSITLREENGKNREYSTNNLEYSRNISIEKHKEMIMRVSSTMKPLVLTVEDEQIIDELYRTCLINEGYHIYLPISEADEVLGIMNVTKFTPDRPLSLSDIEFLFMLCSQSSIGLSSVRLYKKLQNAHIHSIKALAASIDAKDGYTCEHSERVREYALMGAMVLGLNERELDALNYAGLLHDIGKIGVPQTVLSKPGSLDSEEWDIIKQHPAIGARIVRDIPFLSDSSELILHHHERYDGNGYPDGLSRDGIPSGARLLAVADAFDAMTSDRAYRRRMRAEEAFEELDRCAGRNFCPSSVEAFVCGYESQNGIQTVSSCQV